MKRKTNLDEMQEQNLLKLEHRVCSLTYWLLMAAVVGQILIDGSPSNAWVELGILLILGAYLIIGCLRHGLCKKRSSLDEMELQQMLKLEHNVYWMAYSLLILAILVQIFTDCTPKAVNGELVVLLIICIVLVAGCLRLGIWDRRLEANLKTNLLVSLIPGFAVGLVTLVHSLHAYGYTNFLATAVTFLLPFVFTYILTFALLSLSAAIYRKRKEKLEKE